MSVPSTEVAKVKQEILETEQTYVTNLRNLKNFIDHLKEVEKIDGIRDVSESLRGNPDFQEFLKEMEKITPILNMSENLFKELQEADTSEKIAKIFFEYAPFFRVYEPYIGSFEKCNALLLKLGKNKRFMGITKDFQDKPAHNNQTLFSFLIMPVQRLPRYVLLLTELQKQTLKPDQPESRSKSQFKTQLNSLLGAGPKRQGLKVASPTVSLDQALAKVKASTTFINEAIKSKELRAALFAKSSKKHGRHDKRKAKSVEFSSEKAFFKKSSINKDLIKRSLDGMGVKITQDLNKDGIIKCKINNKEIAFGIAKGKAGAREKGKHPSTNFHVKIKGDITRLTPGELAQCYRVAEKIGIAIIENTPREKLKNPSVLNPYNQTTFIPIEERVASSMSMTEVPPVPFKTSLASPKTASVPHPSSSTQSLQSTGVSLEEVRGQLEKMRVKREQRLAEQSRTQPLTAKGGKLITHAYVPTKKPAQKKPEEQLTDKSKPKKR